MYDSGSKEFLDHFFNFILLCKGVAIWTYIWGKASWDEGNGVIMDTAGRRESLGSGKDCLMSRKEGLEVLGHGWDLGGLYGVELGYDTRMTFFEKFFHAMRTDDFRRTRDDALKFMFVASLVKLHG
jgi:hypothetical protein